MIIEHFITNFLGFFPGLLRNAVRYENGIRL